MKTIIVSVRCGHCDGAGHKAAPELTRTLALLGCEWAKTENVAAQLGVKINATCNRLADLLRLGLVDRKGAGARYSPFEWRLKREACGGEKKITVCDKCLRECCWAGEFMCDEARAAGTTELAVSEASSD